MSNQGIAILVAAQMPLWGNAWVQPGPGCAEMIPRIYAYNILISFVFTSGGLIVP